MKSAASLFCCKKYIGDSFELIEIVKKIAYNAYRNDK